MTFPRRLVLVNVALIAVGVVSAGYIVRELRAPAAARARRPAPAPSGATTPPPPAAETQSGGYGVVASRNLFSPTRTEAPVAPSTAAQQLPKPHLYGIILRDGAPVAYLEDPTTKRVAGYRLGDSVAGGTVKQIGADHVVLNRPEGDVNVRLRDPSKPRPVAPPTASPQPGAPPGAITAPPGVPPPVVSQPAPSVTPPQQPPQVLPRRPLPPNLLRRLPPSANDAPPAQQ